MRDFFGHGVGVVVLSTALDCLLLRFLCDVFRRLVPYELTLPQAAVVPF